MACIALTIAGIVAIIAAGFGLFVFGFVRKLNAADRADKADEDWGDPYVLPGDMFDPHRRK